MKTNQFRKLRNICFIAFGIVLLTAITHVSIGIILLSQHLTSAPWYTPIFSIGIFYVLPILLLLGLSVIMQKKAK